jgi:acid phosphatase (class A)
MNSSRCSLRCAAALILAAPLWLGCESSQHATTTHTAQTEHFNYIPVDAVKLDDLLPKPSPDKSPISKGEGDLMIAIQAESSPAAKDRAKSEVTMTPWIFADVLGAGFSKENMPLTAAILDKTEQDTRAATEDAKRLWDRARPPRQDSRITPFLKVPGSASYPSGHAVRATVWARVLGAMDPKDKEALRERARLVALDRVIAGVHYPTDVAAGMALGDAIADQLVASPAFKADIEKAKAEWASH